MATHSSVLAWRIPGTWEPGGLLSMGSHRVGHDLMTKQQQFFSSKNYLKIWGMLKSMCFRSNLRKTAVKYDQNLLNGNIINFIVQSLLNKVYEQKGSQLRRQQRETQNMRNWVTGLLGENL